VGRRRPKGFRRRVERHLSAAQAKRGTRGARARYGSGRKLGTQGPPVRQPNDAVQENGTLGDESKAAGSVWDRRLCCMHLGY